MAHFDENDETDIDVAYSRSQRLGLLNWRAITRGAGRRLDHIATNYPIESWAGRAALTGHSARIIAGSATMNWLQIGAAVASVCGSAFYARYGDRGTPKRETEARPLERLWAYARSHPFKTQLCFGLVASALGISQSFVYGDRASMGETVSGGIGLLATTRALFDQRGMDTQKPEPESDEIIDVQRSHSRPVGRWINWDGLSRGVDALNEMVPPRVLYAAVQCLGATGFAIEGAASLLAVGPTLGGSMLLFAGLSFYGHNALVALSERRLSKAFLDPGVGAQIEHQENVRVPSIQESFNRHSMPIHRTNGWEP